MKQPPLHASVHRMLAVRIASVALVVSMALGAIAWLSGTNRVESTVTELALAQVGRFNRSVLELLDRSVGFERALMQEALEQFSAASGRTELSDGRFVLVRVFDAEGIELAQIADTGHANFDAVNERVNTARFERLAADEYRSVTVEIDGATYVGVAVPMTDSAGGVAAQVLGAFAVSEVAIVRIRSGVLRTVILVMGIVLLTAIAIYPIIAGLLRRMSRLTVDLLDANLETMQVLGGAIAKRDSDTDAHNYRVTVYSVALAETVGLPPEQIRSLIKGALLHDVGKLGIRDDVLLKPGKLTAEEFEVMKTHVEHGIDITARSSWLADAQDVVGGHHEKYDGAGYPGGIAGVDIPVNARIFAIADVFDALTSRRPYKEPMSYETTMEILANGRGSHFDPGLLDAFGEISKDLYAQYGGHDDGRAQRRLESLNQTYFRGNLADMLS